jgi:uncharacterized protein (TIGR03067 family)
MRLWQAAALLSIATVLLGAPRWAVGDSPRDEAVKKEIKQFQGSWKAVSIRNVDGKQAPDDQIQNTRLIVEGNKFTLTSGEATIKGTFTINPSATPRTIDVSLTSMEGKEIKFLGIYQVQGDTRKSCFALPGKERPSQFTSKPGYLGFEWKRK